MTEIGTLGRRALLGTSAAGVVLSGRRARAQAPVTLTMGVWAAQAEEAAFRAAAAQYTAQHPNVTVNLEVSGNAQFMQLLDTRLAGRQAPDVVRMQYQQLGRYAGARALLDLTPYLPAGYAEAFDPVFWQAVSYKGKPYALPHHTDTFALYYNVDMLRTVGVDAPASLDGSWTWQRFMEVARDLKSKAGAPYGFAMSWQNAAYRWLPYLYQHGGSLLNADLTQSQLAARPGVETIAWTQSWFTDGLVPPSTSIKSGEQPQNLFANGTVGMYLGGDWQIPFLSKTMKAPWAVTFMPRDVAMASDLGGNALAVTRDCKHPDVAADLVKFMTEEASARDFAINAQFLPVRRALIAADLPYALRPDAMAVFKQQTTTIPVPMVAAESLPAFSKINAALADQLDLAFTSGQDPAATAQAIDARVQAVLAA